MDKSFLNYSLSLIHLNTVMGLQSQKNSLFSYFSWCGTFFVFPQTNKRELVCDANTSMTEREEVLFLYSVWFKFTYYKEHSLFYVLLDFYTFCNRCLYQWMRYCSCMRVVGLDKHSFNLLFHLIVKDYKSFILS